MGHLALGRLYAGLGEGEGGRTVLQAYPLDGSRVDADAFGCCIGVGDGDLPRLAAGPQGNHSGDGQQAERNEDRREQPVGLPPRGERRAGGCSGVVQVAVSHAGPHWVGLTGCPVRASSPILPMPHADFRIRRASRV